MEKIIELSYRLKELINNDSRIIELSQKDELLKNDSDIKRLSTNKDKEIENLEFMLNHFSKDSKEVEEAQKRLHKAKLELDSHPLTKEYLLAYSKVRDLYLEINNILFSFIDEKRCAK